MKIFLILSLLNRFMLDTIDYASVEFSSAVTFPDSQPKRDVEFGVRVLR